MTFARYMEQVARALLGEPNRQPTPNPTELRYGTHGSLAIDLTKGQFYDHEATEGGGVLDLIKREKGLTGKDAIGWMREIGCDVSSRTNGTRGEKPKLVETFDYLGANGQLLFQVCRYEPKAFKQRRPNGCGGWDWNVKGVAPVPYRFP